MTETGQDTAGHTHTHTGCDTVGETLTFISKYALTVTSTSRCIFAKAESQWSCPGEGSGQGVGSEGRYRDLPAPASPSPAPHKTLSFHIFCLFSSLLHKHETGPAHSEEATAPAQLHPQGHAELELNFSHRRHSDFSTGRAGGRSSLAHDTSQVSRAPARQQQAEPRAPKQHRTSASQAQAEPAEPPR